MLVNVVYRASISKDLVDRFSAILCDKCRCIVRSISEDVAPEIISQSYIDELIFLSGEDKITLYGAKKSDYPDLMDKYLFSEYTGETYSIDTVVGIGFPVSASDETITDICTGWLQNIISYAEHNWYKNEKGWWSRAIHSHHLCHLNKNGISKTYYIDDDHYMQTGWQVISVDNHNVRLYFDPNGGELKFGWQLIEGVWYYFHKDFPHVSPGIVVIDNKEYQISSDGALLGYDSSEQPTEVPNLY